MNPILPRRTIHALAAVLWAVFVLALNTSAQESTNESHQQVTDQPDELRPIDPVRGRQLMQKASRGETLTTQEQDYLVRVKAAIRERGQGIRTSSEPNDGIDVGRVRTLMQRSQDGETLIAEEQAYLDRAQKFMRQRSQQPGGTNTFPANRPLAPVDPRDWIALVPITDMTVQYKGEDGGLYGGGSNEPPEEHRAAHLLESQQIRPLDANGAPSDDGKIGLVTIGFSNTSIESEHFKRAADSDPQKSPQVIIINGAIGGRSAVMWAWDGADALPKAEQDRLEKEMDVVGMPKGKRRPTGLEKDTWPTLANRIKDAGLSPPQVQACWLKHVEANPKPLGNFPKHARALQQDITAILNIAKHHYPNLRVVYLSSRTFGGWSGRASGSPEPYAYESGFGTRWVVQSQIKGDPILNFDPARGKVRAPLVLWGPYLWAQGDSPRKLDGLTWTQTDVRADQLHPNEAGSNKTTTLLLNFFKTNEGTSSWFLKPGETAEVVPLPGSTLVLSHPADAAEPNSLSDAEKKDGWKLLFDGRSTTGWRGYKSDTMPQSWRVENGSLLSRREQGASSGDIITTDQFDDFELILQWKMTEGNNSGVIYRATEQHDQIWQSGPEYQILDNAGHLDGLNSLASAGACYAVFAPSRDLTRPIGQWNQTRVLARGKHVEHWLNNEKLLEYEIDSEKWKAHVKTSKFFPTAYGQGNWGQAKKGHIGLQDYGGSIEFRNLKIRAL